MFTWLWWIIGKIVTQDCVIEWLIKRAEANPYRDIVFQDGLYMKRGWIIKRYWNLPAIRLHHIRRADMDKWMHSHPFNFHTIILRGWYIQEWPGDHWPDQKNSVNVARMQPGKQARCKYGDFHRITQVSRDGCLTLFFTWGGKKDNWGFMTDKGYVRWQDHGQEAR